MKLKFFLAAICMVMGLSLSAQPGKPGKAPRQFPDEKMIKELNLTPQQVTDMKNLFDQQRAEGEKFRQEQRAQAEKQKMNREEMKAAMEKRREEHRAKIKAILTPEQYTKYLEMQLEQRDRMPQMPRQKPDGKRPHGEKGRAAQQQAPENTNSQK